MLWNIADATYGQLFWYLSATYRCFSELERPLWEIIACKHFRFSCHVFLMLYSYIFFFLGEPLIHSTMVSDICRLFHEVPTGKGLRRITKNIHSSSKCYFFTICGEVNALVKTPSFSQAIPHNILHMLRDLVLAYWCCIWGKPNIE